MLTNTGKQPKKKAKNNKSKQKQRAQSPTSKNVLKNEFKEKLLH